MALEQCQAWIPISRIYVCVFVWFLASFLKNYDLLICLPIAYEKEREKKLGGLGGRKDLERIMCRETIIRK